MDVTYELSEIASLIGEPARALMLWSLLDGRTRPAGELAFCANVSPQSASIHLAKLVEAEMLTVEAHGRYRYYSIARAEVAHVIESMAVLIPSAAKSKPFSRALGPDFRIARTCYDHLAGKLAVEMAEAMQKQGLLLKGEKDFSITDAGANWLQDFGIEVAELKQNRRAFAKKCLDWSERQHHIAGSLGAALLHRLTENKWIDRSKTGRTLRTSLEGRRKFEKLFEIYL